MAGFAHKEWPIYREGIALVVLVADGLRNVPRRFLPLSDQMMRAASSIPLNTAEGAGEFSPKEKARFYRMARRSAYESDAAGDALEAARAVTPEFVREVALRTNRIAGMLTLMVKKVESRVKPKQPRPKALRPRTLKPARKTTHAKKRTKRRRP